MDKTDVKVKNVYDKLKSLEWDGIRNENVSSWAIWDSPQEDDEKKTSNMTVDKIFKDESFIEGIKTDYVFIGLNASSDADKKSWASFHKQGSNDYKLRYALMGTKYWGSYITDVIKYLPDKNVELSNSQAVIKYLNDNKEIIDTNIGYLEKELLNFENPTLVAMGVSAYEILNECLKDKYRIIRIPHFSAYISKDNYRIKVLETLGKKQAIDFLICCYFGQSEELIDAAISRAYVDMAKHTMTGFGDSKEETNRKWECRYNSSVHIKTALENYKNDTCFVSWHKELIEAIQKEYKSPELHYGQAQKWLNMTIKYLYILRIILGEEDSRLSSFRDFYRNTSVSDYYPPIDSKVLKGAKIIPSDTWSSMNETQYKNVMDQMGKEKDFMWELENWEGFSKLYPDYDSKSYAYFLEEKAKTRNNT